jgi:hypothetical protein
MIVKSCFLKLSLNKIIKKIKMILMAGIYLEKRWACDFEMKGMN